MASAIAVAVLHRNLARTGLTSLERGRDQHAGTAPAGEGDPKRARFLRNVNNAPGRAPSDASISQGAARVRRSHASGTARAAVQAMM
jgi:hypothetical protein